MAGTSIDSYTIDLTLSIDEFKRKAEEARSVLNKTFSTASSNAQALNSEIAKFKRQWSHLGASGLKDRLDELKSMDGVTKEIRAEIEKLDVAISKYKSGTGNITDVRSAFSGVKGSVDTYSSEALQRKQEGEQKINDIISQREVIEDNLHKKAQADIADENQAIQDGLAVAKRDAEYYYKTLEAASYEYHRHKEALNDISNALVQARDALTSAKADAAAFFQVQGISYDPVSGKGVSEVSYSDETKQRIEEHNRLIAEKEKLVNELTKSYQQQENLVNKYNKDYKKALDEQKNQLRNLRDEVDKTYSRIGFSIATILATVGATKFYKEAIEAAGELEKSTQRLVNLFGELGNEATYAAEEIASSYGMSNKTASQTLGYVGNLMKAYGLTNKMALDLAEGVTELSADLASFSGGTKTAEQAAQSLSQALLGNYRATRDLGIAITNTEVKLMAKSLGMSTEALTQGELALLRYKVIQEQAVNVVGDFARSQDTYYVATQKATAALDNLKASFGEELLPVLTKALDLFTNVVTIVDKMPGTLKVMITTTSLLTASYIALRAILIPLINNIKKARNSFLELQAAEQGVIGTSGKLSGSLKALGVSFASHPVVAVISVLTALAGVITLVSKKQQEEAEATTLSIDKLTKAIREYEDAVVSASTKDPIKKSIVTENFTSSIESLVSQLESNFIKLTQKTDDYNQTLEKTKQRWHEIADAYERLSKMDPAARDTLSMFEYGKSYNQIAAEYSKIADERESTEEALAELDAKYNAERKAGLTELARAYMVNEDIVSNVLDGHEELKKQVLDIVASFKVLNEYGYNEEEILRAMNYEAIGWSNEIDSANKKLLDYQNKRLENEGEYRQAVLNTIATIEDEKKVRDKDIRGRALYEEQSLLESLTGVISANAQKGLHDELSDLFDKVQETGDVSSISISLDNIEETYGLDEGALDRFKALLMLMGESYELALKTREATEEEYANRVYKINENLQSRLTTLESKSAQTLDEQRQASLDKLRDTYQKYVDEVYAAAEGAKGILGDTATDEEVAKIKEAIKNIKDGIRPEFIEDEFGITTIIGDISVQGKEAKAFFEDLLKYYDAYMKGRANIDDDYNKKIAKAQSKQQQTINTLNAAISRDRNKIHQTELDNLELERIQRIEDAQTSGEDVTKIEEEFRLKRLQSEEEFLRETIEIRRDANRSYLEQMKGMTSDVALIYEIEKQLLDDELQYELDHAEETGKDKLAIRREYVLKEIQLEREKEAAIREEQKRNLDFWNYGNVNQDGDFLNAAVNSYFQMDQEFTERFRQAKQDLEMAISEDWGALFSKYAGTDMEGPLKQIQDTFLTAADDKDLLGIRTLIDNLKDTKPELYEAINDIIPEDAWDKAEERNKQRAKALANIITSTITSTLSAINDLLSSVEDSEMNYIKRRIEVMKDEYNAFKEQVEARNDKSYKNLTRSQKDAIERQKKLDEEELKRQKSLIDAQEDLLKKQQNEQFERQKAFSIASATITGIMAAINAYSGGMAMAPFLGIGAAAAPALAAGMMAASLATTAAQIAMIANQQAPSYAQGAYNLPQDQMAQVHKGEMIIPKPFAEEIRDSGGFGGEVIVNVYGATDEVSVESSEADNQKQLDIYLTKRVKTMVARGELDGALQTRYAISKNGRRA